jgi:hypothetical protein
VKRLNVASTEVTLLEQGIYPRLDAFSPGITDENGNINPMPDISPYLDYDFII